MHMMVVRCVGLNVRFFKASITVTAVNESNPDVGSSAQSTVPKAVSTSDIYSCNKILTLRIGNNLQGDGDSTFLAT